MEKISISGKETKQHIRAALKMVFPGFKFSLTSDFDSVRVAWTDGPLVPDVNKVLNRFESYTHVLAHTDFKKATGYEWDGAIYVGAKYLNTSRQLSDERRAALVQYMEDEGVGDFNNANVSERVQVERDMIAKILLPGTPSIEHADLMRDQPPQEDQRPKKKSEDGLMPILPLERLLTATVPAGGTGSASNVVVFPQRSRKQAFTEGLTPEQLLKLHVLEVFFQKDFLERNGTTVDEIFELVANELYPNNRGE